MSVVVAGTTAAVGTGAVATAEVAKVSVEVAEATAKTAAEVAEKAAEIAKEAVKTMKEVVESTEKVMENAEHLKEQVSLSPKEIADEAFTAPKDVVESGIEHIKCINEGLEGQVHPVTGVPFEKKIIEVDGCKKEGVFPKFESKFEVQLPQEKIKSSDTAQFNECNKQLAETVKNNPDIANKFTSIDLEQIMDGETPDGYTWHHDAEVGKMKLVDYEIHQKTAHTGGASIWGGKQ